MNYFLGYFLSTSLKYRFALLLENFFKNMWKFDRQLSFDSKILQCNRFFSTVLEDVLTALELCFDRARCMLRPCSRYVFTVLEVYFVFMLNPNPELVYSFSVEHWLVKHWLKEKNWEKKVKIQVSDQLQIRSSKIGIKKSSVIFQHSTRVNHFAGLNKSGCHTSFIYGEMVII